MWHAILLFIAKLLGIFFMVVLSTAILTYKKQKSPVSALAFLAGISAWLYSVGRW